MRSFFSILSLRSMEEERQFAAPLGILFRGALHLPERQLHTHLRQYLARFLQADVMRLLNHSFPSSAALRYGPVL
jgi:hypothetical protein